MAASSVAKTETPRLQLLDLPNEVIIQIAESIPASIHLSYLVRSCRTLYELLNVVLYRQDQLTDNGNGLLWSVAADKCETVQRAISLGIDVANTKWSLIHAATEFQVHNVLVLLANQPGIRIDALDSRNTTALWWTCEYDQIRSAKLLLRLGASFVEALRARNRIRDLTPAQRQTWDDMARFLIETDEHNVRDEDTTIFQLLIAAATRGRNAFALLVRFVHCAKGPFPAWAAVEDVPAGTTVLVLIRRMAKHNQGVPESRLTPGEYLYLMNELGQRVDAYAMRRQLHTR